MLKYEKKIEKKASKVEKHSKTVVNKGGEMASSVKDTVHTGVEEDQQLPSRLYKNARDFQRDKADAAKDYIDSNWDNVDLG